MSENTAAAPAETESAKDSDAEASEKDWKAEAEKWKRMSREQEKRAKENADAAKRLESLEIANMSDLERAQKERDEAKAEVEKLPSLVADHLRAYLTEIHGISEENRDLYLTSSDPATLLKQAVGIASRTEAAPKPDLTQGAQHAMALNGDGLTQALERAVGRRT